jgi:hypothetical protein
MLFQKEFSKGVSVGTKRQSGWRLRAGLSGIGSTLAVLFVVLSLSSQGLGTIGIIAYNDTTFWVVTDSRASDPWGNPVGGVCKIRSAGGFYWFAVTPFYNDERGFSLPQTIDSVTFGEGTLPSKLEQFKTEVAVPLAAELRQLKTIFTHEPATTLRRHLMLASIVTGHWPPLDIVFVGLDKKKHPSVAWLTLNAREISGIIYIEGTPEQEPAVTGQAPHFFLLGQRDVAEPFLKQQMAGPFPAQNFVEAMREAVAREETQPGINYVGGPISILQVDENGPFWIDPGACN